VTFVLFEGGAGTGKTTALLARLQNVLINKPLRQGQKVLALTKMHGSRRRLHQRLNAMTEVRNRFDCITIDSLAYRLCQRWRTLSRHLSPTVLPRDYDDQCVAASMLLRLDFVREWVAASFPIVLVDELQDSKNSQLEVIKGLAVNCCCLCAGDPFQDLDGDAACDSLAWARTQGEGNILEVVHRTNVGGLLAAATALRNGGTVVSGSGFELVGVPAAGLGSWEVAIRMKRWMKLGTLAVLSPVGVGRSQFVNSIVNRVQSEPPLGQKVKIGPFRLPWETTSSELVDDQLRQIGLENADAHINIDDLKNARAARSRLYSWALSQRRLSGRTTFSSGEIREAVKRIVQAERSQSVGSESGTAAMTIHQAKNREFDRAILLWPYEISGSDERLRRFAYNAITRARQEVCVVVQNKARLRKPPFV
jgi:superfamily I DNA/RNA helicase